jgi:hypothetical protein
MAFGTYKRLRRSYTDSLSIGLSPKKSLEFAREEAFPRGQAFLKRNPLAAKALAYEVAITAPGLAAAGGYAYLQHDQQRDARRESDRAELANVREQERLTGIQAVADEQQTAIARYKRRRALLADSQVSQYAGLLGMVGYKDHTMPSTLLGL